MQPPTDAAQGPTSADRRDALLAEYAEVNNNFRMLTEIRFKLLAFLPVAAAVSAAVVARTTSGTADGTASDATALALSLFGLVVTVGLAAYNTRNDQVYVWLVSRGASIEREIGVPDGSFSHRPNAWWEVRLSPRIRWHVGHVSSVAAIYSASIALWLFGCLVAGAQLAWSSHEPPGWVYAAAVIAAVVVTASCGVALRASKRTRREKLPDKGQEAIALAVSIRRAKGQDVLSLGGYETFVRLCASLIGPDRTPDERMKEVTRRINYFAEMSEEERRQHIRPEIDEANEAASYVSLIVDLPTTMLRTTPQRR